MFKWLTRYLLLFLIIPFSINTYGQKVSADYSNLSLTEVLTAISQQYHIKIAFDTQLADKIAITQSLKQIPIEKALSLILNNSGLKVQRMGDVYMVIPDLNPVKRVPDGNSVQQTATTKTRKFIYGAIKDMQSGEALPFASIYLKNNHQGITSNADGIFKLETKDEDSIYLVINYIGYEPFAIKAKASSHPELLQIRLNPQLQQLQAIVISPKIEVFENRGTQPDVIKFCPSKLENIPSINELDISTPLQMLPGISGCTENAGGFSIRKAPTDKTLMVFDGFTLYHMNHFFGAFSAINTKSIKDIQVRKIPGDANLGGSSAGLIEITGKSGNMQDISVNAGIDMLATDVEIEIPIIKNKCSFLFAGRRSFTDKFRTPLYNAMFDNARYEFLSYYRKPPVAFSSGTGDPQYYFGDFNSKISINTSEKSTLSLSAFGSKDDLNFSQLAAYPKIKENTNWQTKGFSIRWAGDVNTSWNTELVSGYSNTTFDYTLSDSIQKFRKRLVRTVEYIVSKGNNIDLYLKNFSIQNNNKINTSEKGQLIFGAGMQVVSSYYGLNAFAWVNSMNILDTSRIYKENSKITSAWLQYEWKNEYLTIKPGLRVNHYKLLNKNYPELRGTMFIRPVNKLILRVEAGNFYQFVNKVDFVRHGDFRSAWILSDGEKYPVASSKNIALGVNYNITSRLNIDIEAYYNQMFDLTSSQTIYKITTNNNIKLANISWLYDNKVKGLDVLLKQDWQYYQIWLSYTLSEAKNKAPQNSTTQTYTADNDQMHEVKLLQLFNYKNFSISWSNIGGSGIVWDEYILDNNLQLTPDYQKNSGSAPFYYRMDAGANYTLKLSKCSLKAGINLFNILDRKNLINKFEKLSDTPIADINQGLNPLEETSVYGLGVACNFFLNISF
ncbi:MAG TPA: TonB-dependent receptor [Bacteroidales bacterium]|nr:TonB-dependent receptor [Bacteroidales bacterium]